MTEFPLLADKSLLAHFKAACPLIALKPVRGSILTPCILHCSGHIINYNVWKIPELGTRHIFSNASLRHAVLLMRHRIVFPTFFSRVIAILRLGCPNFATKKVSLQSETKRNANGFTWFRFLFAKLWKKNFASFRFVSLQKFRFVSLKNMFCFKVSLQIQRRCGFIFFKFLLFTSNNKKIC